MSEQRLEMYLRILLAQGQAILAELESIKQQGLTDQSKVQALRADVAQQTEALRQAVESGQ